MRTLQEKYNAIAEGNFSKTQFKRDAAMELPHFVSNINSFEDTVSILKNKGVLSESKKQEQKYSTATAADHIAPDVLDTGIKFELDAKYGTLDVAKEDYDKIREKAIKNLSKDVLYYVKKNSEQLETPKEEMEKVKLNEGEWKDKGQSQELNRKRLADLKVKKAEAEKKGVPAGIIATMDKEIKELEALLNEGEWKDKGQSQELNKERLANLKAKKAEAEKKGVPAGIIATMDKEIRELEALLHEDAEYDKYIDDLAKERENRHDSAQTEYEKVAADLDEEEAQVEEPLKKRIAKLTNELLAEKGDMPAVKAFAIQIKNDIESGDPSRLTKYESILTKKDLEELMQKDITEDINESSEQDLYKVHKFLKGKLDKKAVEAGDRMSYFSAEFPLASTFAKDVKKVIQEPVNESEYDEQSKSEGLAELRDIFEELGDLSKRAYDTLQVYFPTYLRKAKAYGALDFGVSSNKHDTTLESIIDEIQEDGDALSEDQDFTLTPDEREEQEREKFASYSTGKEREALKEMFKKIIVNLIND
jgi:hypothetical protein